MDDLLARAREVAPLVRGAASDAEQQRHLTAEVVAALTSRSLFRMFVPAAYDGPEAVPMVGMEAIEIVAGADGAAGWCVNIASTTATMSWYLAPEWSQLIYGDPNVVTGGSFAPNGIATVQDGGWSLDGSWAWGSGTDHCQWINCGARTSNGEFHLMYVPQAEVEFLDTWHSAGLKGTASTDYAVHGAVVPHGRSVQPGVSRALVDAQLCHFPNFGLLAAGLACVALGIGRRAVEELSEMAVLRKPAMSSKPLAESAFVQLELARAEAGLSSARAFLFEETANLWDAVGRGDRISLPQRARLRLAAHHAAAAAAEAVDRCYTSAGGAAVYLTSPLQRCLRDVHVATQHAMLSPRNLETYARVTLGLPADTTLL